MLQKFQGTVEFILQLHYFLILNLVLIKLRLNQMVQKWYWLILSIIVYCTVIIIASEHNVICWILWRPQLWEADLSFICHAWLTAVAFDYWNRSSILMWNYNLFSLVFKGSRAQQIQNNSRGIFSANIFISYFSTSINTEDTEIKLQKLSNFNRFFIKNL